LDYCIVFVLSSLTAVSHSSHYIAGLASSCCVLERNDGPYPLDVQTPPYAGPRSPLVTTIQHPAMNIPRNTRLASTNRYCSPTGICILASAHSSTQHTLQNNLDIQYCTIPSLSKTGLQPASFASVSAYDMTPTHLQPFTALPRGVVRKVPLPSLPGPFNGRAETTDHKLPTVLR
jgi:hypothetical protein